MTPSFAWSPSRPSLTMFVFGFWHGAGWQFAIFGLLHGPSSPSTMPGTRCRRSWGLPGRQRPAHAAGASCCSPSSAWSWPGLLPRRRRAGSAEPSHGHAGRPWRGAPGHVASCRHGATPTNASICRSANRSISAFRRWSGSALLRSWSGPCRIRSSGCATTGPRSPLSPGQAGCRPRSLAVWRPRAASGLRGLLGLLPGHAPSRRPPPNSFISSSEACIEQLSLAARASRPRRRPQSGRAEQDPAGRAAAAVELAGYRRDFVATDKLDRVLTACPAMPCASSSGCPASRAAWSPCWPPIAWIIWRRPSGLPAGPAPRAPIHVAPYGLIGRRCWTAPRSRLRAAVPAPGARRARGASGSAVGRTRRGGSRGLGQDRELRRFGVGRGSVRRAKVCSRR